MSFQRLFRPLRVNGMDLKNRIVMTAVQSNFTPGGAASPLFCQYYWQRAAGGAGLVVVGGARFDAYGAAGADFMSLAEDSLIPGWRIFTDGMHQRGAKVAVQLYHAGRYTKERNLPEGEKALAPSAVYAPYTHETAREMTREEIWAVTERWALAAARAQKAGFDAVEIIASAGYLLSQFLSPLTNLRADEYGGSWSGRTRFPREVLSAVRAAVGPDYPVIVRIAGNDFVPGSNTNEEAVAFAELMEQAGADMISVTGGWHETKVPQLPGEVPRAGFAYLAAAVREAVSVPVIACNRINDPWVAEEVLALEQGDCVGMARTLIADPEWPNKVRAGRIREIRPCVACNQGCLAGTFFGKPVHCLVNGLAGWEDRTELEPAQAPKRILVVGGGPAGAEFAIRASQRGHEVALWERRSALGGQLPLAAAPPGKGEFLRLEGYYRHMLAVCGVEVTTGRTATAEDILEQGYDAVVVATGSRPKAVPVPGDGSVEVVTAAQVLSGGAMPGRRVVVVGGGAVGCETAQFLAQRGGLSPEQFWFLSVQRAESPQTLNELLDHTARQVSILEIAPKLGAGFDPGCGWPVMKDLKRLGVAQYPMTRLKEARSGAVLAEQERDGAVRQLELPCDTVVLAVGSAPEDELYRELKGKRENVYLIGDAQTPGRVLDAVRQAVELAADI